LVERWFAELSTRKLRRSAHRSVTELESDIRKWINEWNKNPRPFTRPPTTWPACPATSCLPASRTATATTLTPDGLRFAIFYTKVHDRLLRPLMAADPRPRPRSGTPCAP